MAANFQLTFSAVLIVLVTIAAETCTAQPQIAPEEAPGEVLAVQLHRQGHHCDAPVTAKRDAARSKPDEAVWGLKCANGSYRMRLIPNMAAVVERLD